MGVLRCDRAGCENIMCDRYSYKYGYLCSGCFDELVESDLDIDVFMKTGKNETRTMRRHTLEEYMNEFKWMD